ncbi:hypothetical protein [Clostridium sp.]|uniref:hypothetical protein n=1 Tax=Clostridium sp. TaxID=1506 RepID=UPI003F671F35
MDLEDAVKVCACMWSGREVMLIGNEKKYTDFIEESRLICSTNEHSADYICSKAKKLNEYLDNAIM